MTDDKPRPLPKGLSLPNPKSSPALKLAFATALEMAAPTRSEHLGSRLRRRLPGHRQEGPRRTCSVRAPA